MARPSYAAELNQYISDQLAQAQAQSAEEKSQAYAQADREQAEAQARAKKPGDEASVLGNDEATLPYGLPRSPMPAEAPRQAPPSPPAAEPGGYLGGLAAPSPASPGAPTRSRGVVAAPAAQAAPPPALNAVALDEEITRLQQMRVWLSDPLTCAVIDKFIGQRLSNAERRQVYYSVAAGVVSLIAGWLLSAISPASVILGVFHH